MKTLRKIQLAHKSMNLYILVRLSWVKNSLDKMKKLPLGLARLVHLEMLEETKKELFKKMKKLEKLERPVRKQPSI